MFNIIKSLNYSARRDTVNWVTIISMLVLPGFVMVLNGMLGGESYGGVSSSVFFASQQMATYYIFLMFGIMILACKVVAGDAGDKTINYEFMAGHSRGRVFAGRMISGFLWGGILNFIFLVLPLGYLYFIYGWGLETDMKNVLIRSALCFFPIIRICALNMMLASVVRSAGKGIALSYAVLMVVAMITSILSDALGVDIVYPTAMTNGTNLLVSENAKYEVINGKTVSVYDTAVSSEMIWKTIVVSLIFTAIYMTITYINFKKKDRD